MQSIPTQTVQQLNQEFGLGEALQFDEPHVGMIRAKIATTACTAELYLQGAHVTRWQPAGEERVLFVSERTAIAPGKPIRGGVPVILPWFGPRTAEVTGGRTDGPSHGFARTSVWQLAFAALSGEDLHVTLTLGPNEASKELGFDAFRVAYRLVLGRALTMELTVANDAEQPLVFEEALHTYLEVANAEDVRLRGLGGTEFLDKTENFARKRQQDAVLTLQGETDRPYLNTDATVTLEDRGLARRIVVAKRGSQTTVVWNPWSALAAKIADMTPEGWRTMTCVETANAAENRVTLAPHATHTMQARITVERA